MNKNDKYIYWKIFRYTGIGIILIVGLVNLLMLFSTPITAKGENDWIGFYGSLAGGLIGGFATLIGIKMTLDFTLTSEKEKKKLELKPYIQIQGEITREHLGSDFGIIEFQGEVGKDSDLYAIQAQIKNIGLGTAINIEFMLNDVLPHPMMRQFSVGVGDSTLRAIIIPVHKSKRRYKLNIYFNDLLENAYSQAVYLMYEGGKLTMEDSTVPTIIEA